MSVSLCLSVCLSACLLAYLKNEMSKVPNFTEILCMSPTAVVRSFFSRVAIRYVLPVFFADGAMFARNRSGDASKASTRMTHQGQHWRDTGRSDCFCLYIRQQLVTPYRTRDIPSLAWGHCGALGHVPPPLYFQRFVLFFYRTLSEL